MRKLRNIILLAISSLMAIPFATAARTGFASLDTGIEMMSKIFYPSILLRNQSVQIGFFKFLYFIIIFTLVNWALSKFVFKADGEDSTSKRASSVIAFSFAAISAWFMPDKVALGTAGLITAIFNVLIPVGLAIGGIYLAFYKFKGEWWKNLIGMAILMFTIFVITWTLTFIGV